MIYYNIKHLFDTGTCTYIIFRSIFETSYHEPMVLKNARLPYDFFHRFRTYNSRQTTGVSMPASCRSGQHKSISCIFQQITLNSLCWKYAPVEMPQENFEDLPRDQCSDESLRRAQVWQRFLHSDDEHIKVERFCLICGHTEDWEKLSLGLKMKMLVNHHYYCIIMK